MQQHPEVDQEDDPGLPQQPGVQGAEHAGDSTEHETESKLALMNSSINNIRLYLYFSFYVGGMVTVIRVLSQDTLTYNHKSIKTIKIIFVEFQYHWTISFYKYAYENTIQSYTSPPAYNL